MPISGSESTPPPRIGKIGPYTVFVTPPPTPKPANDGPASSPSPPTRPTAPSSPPVQSPPPLQSAPPVQAPPQQYYKSSSAKSPPSSFGFFWDAVAKVQNAHASLDEHVAHWFGLNQSKYQWALDDYYESKGMEQADAKVNGVPSKIQNV